MKTILLQMFAASALILGGLAFAQDQKGGALTAAGQTAATPDAKVIAAQKPAYPLTTCPVSGEKLGSMGEPIDVVVEGRLVRLCCAGCKKGVEKDAKAIIAKINAAVIAEQKPLWPASIDKCLVSGEAFAEAGSIDYVHGTRYVKLCCKGCIKGLEKAPEKFLARVDAAMIEEQKKNYPLEVCVISGEPLGEDPAQVFYGVTLVQTCCKRCAKKVQEKPDAYVAKVKEARAAAGKQG